MSSAPVGIGPTPVEVPPVVHALAQRIRSGTTVVPVWRNEYGGFTVRLEDRRTAPAASGGRSRGPAPEPALPPGPVPGLAQALDPALDPGPGVAHRSGRATARQDLEQRDLARQNRSPQDAGQHSASTANHQAAEQNAMGLNDAGRKNARRRVRSSYLKWVPHLAPCPDPLGEADRLVWADAHVPVPRVVDIGRDTHGSWLLTAAVEVGGATATSAIEPRWRALAQRSAIAVGVGLRRFHDALPTDTCPFVRTAEMRVAALTTDPRVPLAAAERATFSATLGSPPPVDRLVVCHGDATVPNTLLDRAGRFAAHVDVGELGVADRWSDIAVTTRSVTRRYGPGLEPLVLAAYGVAPDQERTAYYRALWDAEEAVRVRRGAS